MSKGEGVCLFPMPLTFGCFKRQPLKRGKSGLAIEAIGAVLLFGCFSELIVLHFFLVAACSLLALCVFLLFCFVEFC